MAGHNKWSKVKHIKARVDAIKGRVFSKCAHEIALAARAGGSDPAANARLRTAIENAKAVSMPKDNIARAIDKATKGEGDNYEEVRYEGYGPGGVAIIVEALTDNRNRTATNVRTAFSKNGGNLGASGAVSHGFERLGLIEYPGKAGDEEKVLEAAIEAGADDVESSEDGAKLETLEKAGRLKRIAFEERDQMKRLTDPVMAAYAKEIGAPFELVKWVHDHGRLPVVNFAAGGIATPADAALAMQLGAQAVFVGSGIFKSDDPAPRAKAIVEATAHFRDAKVLAKVSRNLGAPMTGIGMDQINERYAERGW